MTNTMRTQGDGSVVLTWTQGDGSIVLQNIKGAIWGRTFFGIVLLATNQGQRDSSIVYLRRWEEKERPKSKTYMKSLRQTGDKRLWK